jgi:hypothetical protein
VLVSVLVVCGASAFGRDHGSAEGVVRIAPHGESGAVTWFADATEDLPGDALRLRRGSLRGEGKPRFSVIGPVGFAQSKAAQRKRSETAPLSPDDLENLLHDSLRLRVAVRANGSRILILDLATPLFELLDAKVNTFKNIERFKTGHNDGDGKL